MNDIDEAFEQLKEEFSESDCDTENVASKSKKWVNRYFDLFSGLNDDDMNLSQDEVDRRNQVLRKQQQWANKVIEFATELGQDLSSLDLDDSMYSYGRATKAPTTRDSKDPLVYSLKDEASVFQVDIELPGVNLDDVDIELETETNILVISSERLLIGNETPTKFTQRFVLGPDVDTDKISAKLTQGILTVSAPKEPKNTEDKKLRIPISTQD